MHYPLENKFGLPGPPVMSKLKSFSGKIGQTETLGAGDKTRLRRMYTCPGPGKQGKLLIRVVRGDDLFDEDDTETHPFVLVTAVTRKGRAIVKETRTLDSILPNAIWR
eukprot:Plantae.Rhodophyta-Rhodochaete_pulchella.ctg7920.p1 GENE.Plantae.Rhodophyta-Rhodochaete_pulchella.ctg7920~~Plantae.Rhodophyta-Rhodochaete_pulchella.ctg7920.p1  ORF type:complete len:108 (+),score=16.54 Plantae.Rhodophyta-Rhodochaete_pulchella.ctg7920:682-1005(+)